MRTMLVCLAIMLLICPASAQTDDSPFGSWELLPDRSTDIDLYKNLTVKIQQAPAGILVVDRWGGDRHFVDSLLLPADGRTVQVPITNRVFPSNVFMGLMMTVGRTADGQGSLDRGRPRARRDIPFAGSQGIMRVSAVRDLCTVGNMELLTTGSHVRHVHRGRRRSTCSSGPAHGMRSR